jgi:hypothetical protein
VGQMRDVIALRVDQHGSKILTLISYANDITHIENFMETYIHRAITMAIFSLTLLAGANTNSAADTPCTDCADLNRDSKIDARFEYDDTGYYQLTDRNFDGRMDESTRYDLDHIVVSGSGDDNFDGIFETSVEYLNGFLSRVLVDTNNNKLIDLVHIYKDGLIVSSERFVLKRASDASPTLIKIHYNFGFPISEDVVPATTEGEEGFNLRHSSMPRPNP